MLATPAVVMPLTHTCDGASSMNEPVQSPAREMVSRKPGRPGAGHVGERVPLLQRAAADRGGRPGERRHAVVEVDQRGVRGRPFDDDRHPAQPQPRQRDAHGEHGQHPHARSGRHRAALVERRPARSAPRTAPAPSSRRTGATSRTGRAGGPGTTASPSHTMPTSSATSAYDTTSVAADTPGQPTRRLIGQRTDQHEEPQRPGHRAADVQPAEVVHLRQRPADLQRPVRRRPGGQPEQQVDDVLLPDQDRQREVRQRGVRDRPEGHAAGRPPPAVHGEAEQHQVRGQHGRGEPVVVHQARVLEQPPQPGRLRGQHDLSRRRYRPDSRFDQRLGHAATSFATRPTASRPTAACAESGPPPSSRSRHDGIPFERRGGSRAALSTFPRLVSGRAGSAYTADGRAVVRQGRGHRLRRGVRIDRGRARRTTPGCWSSSFSVTARRQPGTDSSTADTESSSTRNPRILTWSSVRPRCSSSPSGVHRPRSRVRNISRPPPRNGSGA